MNRILWTFGLMIACTGSAQTFSATDFGTSLRLPSGSFEPTRTAPLVGQPLPREGIRLRSLTVLDATFLKTTFTDHPAEYGLRCTGEQDVTLMPGTSDDARAYAASLLKQPTLQPLAQDAINTYLLAPGTVFITVTSYRGAVLIGACRASRTDVTLRILPAQQETFLGSTPYLLTATKDGGLAWCTAGGRPLRAVQAFTGSALAIDVSPDGALVAVAGWDKQPAIKVYDTRSGALVKTVALKNSPLSLSFSGDSKSVLVLDNVRGYRWFDARSGATLNTWSVLQYNSMNLRGGGPNLFVEWSISSGLRVYDGTKGRPKFSLRNFRLSGVTFTPDGQWIVTANTDGILSAFNTRDGKPGPTYAIGVAAGTSVLPGRSSAEVLVLSRQITEGKPDRISVSTWTVGDKTLARQGATDHARANFIVLNEARTTPASIPACVGP